MNKLTLTNEQALALYVNLQDRKLDRAKNRIRWKFLDVIEEKVLAYESLRNEKIDAAAQSRQETTLMQTDQRITYDEKIKKQKEVVEVIKKINEEIKVLDKVKNTYEFNDREVFAQTKALFELSMAETGKTEELIGQNSKLISGIEDAFLDLVDEGQKPQATSQATAQATAVPAVGQEGAK